MKKGRSASHPTYRLVVGWNEYVDFPDWGIRGLRAKMDTGARSSALHVDNIEPRSGSRVSFDVVLHRRHRDRRVRVNARVVRRGRVRSSSGHRTLRPFVVTTVRIGPVERKIEVGLVDRGEMVFRLLLGRTALDGIIIDAGRAALLGRPS